MRPMCMILAILGGLHAMLILHVIFSVLLFGASDTTEDSSAPLPHDRSPNVEHQKQCGISSKTSNYILKGDEASHLEFPWQVSLQFGSVGRLHHGCGASIIDENWLLTAAHCVDPRFVPMTRFLVALLGAHNISRTEESSSAHLINRKTDVYMHPKWNPQLTLDYDYALIQLPKPLDFAGRDSHLMPICLPEAGSDFENMDCIISGWGLTKNSWDPADLPDVLQKLPVTVSRQDDCVHAYLHSGHPDGGPALITPRHICVVSKRGEGSGPCRGDSGGPLQCRIEGSYVLAGATSFGRYCGSADYPAVYSRVSEVLSWIEAIRDNHTRRS